MKKILSLVIAMTVLLVPMSAFAETAESAYTYTEYTYDETLFAEITGDWIATEELGLMFYLPDIYVPAEIPEALAEMGVVGLYGTGEGNVAFTVAYGPALDVEGNAATTVEALADYYVSIGATNVDVIVVNGIPVITSLTEKNDTLSYSVFFEDGTQYIMSFIPASDTSIATLAALMATTLMPYEAE